MSPTQDTKEQNDEKTWLLPKNGFSIRYIKTARCYVYDQYLVFNNNNNSNDDDDDDDDKARIDSNIKLNLETAAIK